MEYYRFSPFVVCKSKEMGKVDGVTEMFLTKACLCVLRCLKEEKDWRVLGLVLQEVPSTLQNKGMLTKFAAVCHPLPNVNTPPKFGRPGFQSAVYPVLAILVSYNRSLEQELQKKLIKCYEYGLLTSKCYQF